MLLSKLSFSPLTWCRDLVAAPWWQLDGGMLTPTDRSFTDGWLILFGHRLGAAHLSKLANLLIELDIKATLYPATSAAGVPILLLGCNSFSALLSQRLRTMVWDIDICHLQLLPTLNKPGLIVMDMDSTAIQIECIDEIARLAGVSDQVSLLTAAAMEGEQPFTESLRRRVALLAGVPIVMLDEVIRQMPWTPRLHLLVDELKQAGWKIAIASGGFTYFGHYLQQALGLDAVLANELTIEHGYLTGSLQGEIVDGGSKARWLLQLAHHYGIDNDQVVAIGDGANDLEMIAAAGLGIAFHAKQRLRAQADAIIEHHFFEGVLCLLQAATVTTQRWGERR